MYGKEYFKTLSKPLIAKEMENAIEAGTYKIGNTCKENFKALFEHVFSCFKD